MLHFVHAEAITYVLIGILNLTELTAHLDYQIRLYACILGTQDDRADTMFPILTQLIVAAELLYSHCRLQACMAIYRYFCRKIPFTKLLLVRYPCSCLIDCIASGSQIFLMQGPYHAVAPCPTTRLFSCSHCFIVVHPRSQTSLLAHQCRAHRMQPCGCPTLSGSHHSHADGAGLHEHTSLLA